MFKSFPCFIKLAGVLTEQQMSLYISNLIYIAPCLFIPSQYDVYRQLSDTGLSGATSKYPSHYRNIFKC